MSETNVAILLVGESYDAIIDRMAKGDLSILGSP